MLMFDWFVACVLSKDKINNEEWKKHDQEKEEEIIIFKKDYQKK